MKGNTINSFEEIGKAFIKQLELLESIDKRLERLESAVMKISLKGKESFNLKEISAMTGLSYSYWHNKTEKNLIPIVQSGPGGKIVILREDLLDFLHKNRIDWTTE